MPSFPRPSQVPLTCALSGIVFLLVMYRFGKVTTWRDEPIILGAWGIVYLGEWAYRRITGRWPASSVERDAKPGAALDDLRVGAAAPQSPDERDPAQVQERTERDAAH